MRFSLYSELQLHPGKTAEQLYGEVLEQIDNADRLGFYAYAAIEHFFFPKFSVSTNPTALFAAAAQRTTNIRFRTMLHTLPYHNPTVLASVINATDILTGGRYEWGVGRGHGWLPTPAGVPLRGFSTSVIPVALPRWITCSAVVVANRCMHRATTPVHPVWWLAPSPAPLSPWKYSQKRTRSRQCGPSGTSPSRRRPVASCLCRAYAVSVRPLAPAMIGATPQTPTTARDHRTDVASV